MKKSKQKPKTRERLKELMTKPKHYKLLKEIKDSPGNYLLAMDKASTYTHAHRLVVEFERQGWIISKYEGRAKKLYVTETGKMVLGAFELLETLKR